MTKFDFYVDGLCERRKQERENEWNALFLKNLQEKSREEMLKEMMSSLTFIVGVSTIRAMEGA